MKIVEGQNNDGPDLFPRWIGDVAATVIDWGAKLGIVAANGFTMKLFGPLDRQAEIIRADIGEVPFWIATAVGYVALATVVTVGLLVVLPAVAPALGKLAMWAVVNPVAAAMWKVAGWLMVTWDKIVVAGTALVMGGFALWQRGQGWVQNNPQLFNFGVNLQPAQRWVEVNLDKFIAWFNNQPQLNFGFAGGNGNVAADNAVRMQLPDNQLGGIPPQRPPVQGRQKQMLSCRQPNSASPHRSRRSLGGEPLALICGQVNTVLPKKRRHYGWNSVLDRCDAQTQEQQVILLIVLGVLTMPLGLCLLEGSISALSQSKYVVISCGKVSTESLLILRDFLMRNAQPCKPLSTA